MKKTWPLFNRLVTLSAAAVGLVACGGGSSSSGSAEATAPSHSSESLTVNTYYAASGAATVDVEFRSSETVSSAVLMIESLPASTPIISQPLALDCGQDCSANWRGLVEAAGELRVRVDFQNQDNQALNVLQDTQLEVGECLRNSTFYQHHVQPELQQHCISCHGLGAQGVFDPRWEWSQFSTLIDEYGDFLHEFPSQNITYTQLGEVKRHPHEALPEDQPAYQALVHLVLRQQSDFDCNNG
ncbi:hypothetical protein CHH28_10760 [Bacterioplanes sanyensis]|uniref:Cytochrome c domain-containing protein n=1 Tax=Bacterioplanes sanyensis TaxID=1249553 RepID=A0A222FL82_9GAMM|nr:hypothetical protein [Bacterioplanes sanyensis]ASP39131.1 hypothetical protein CHH28_10760 [Bacterioplanes sanyensis]